MWRTGTVILFILVVLHAFQPLPSKVLKHNVVIIGVKLYEIGVYWSLAL